MTEPTPDQQSSEKIIKIVKPERVERILTRVFNAHLEVLIRAKANMNVAVRGRASLIDAMSQPASVVVSGLSDQGARYLENVSDVRVEFVGMSTQIVFFSQCLGVAGDSVRLRAPVELVSFDRRANARTVVHEKLASYVKINSWTPRSGDVTAPPVMSFYQDTANYILLADVSEGGVCGITRFPAVLDALDRGSIDTSAELILPLSEPIRAAIEIRWTRRIKESRVLEDGNTRNQRFFRVGMQFINPDERLKLQLKQYVNQLSVAEAI